MRLSKPPRPRSRSRHIFLIVALLGLAGALGACGNSAPPPAPTKISVTPTPPPKSTAAAAAGRLTPDSLLPPAALTFDGTYPEAGWRRCDDFTVGKNLERYRNAYKVNSSVAAVWEYGPGCGGADQEARIDQYAWVVHDEGAAASLIERMNADMYLSSVTPEMRSQVRQFGGSDVSVQTLALPSQGGGKTRFVTEILGQQGVAVAYMRVVTVKSLSDEQYLALARQYLARVAPA